MKIYLFDCAEPELQHEESSIFAVTYEIFHLWHVGSSLLTKEGTQALVMEAEHLRAGPPRESLMRFLKITINVKATDTLSEGQDHPASSHGPRNPQLWNL